MPNDCHLFLPQNPDFKPEWLISEGLTSYTDAVAFMEKRIALIHEGKANELVWLVEHPPLYTAGTGAKEDDLLDKTRFPVFRTGRGGQFTYHGPGQRVIYVMLDLRQRQQDVRAYVCALEEWIIKTLNAFNIKGERRDGRIGVWIRRPDKGKSAEDKIAAIGVRLRKWISFHGVSLNVSSNLAHYDGIIPCGIRQFGVTSFEDLGWLTTMNQIDCVLREKFVETFGGLSN